MCGEQCDWTDEAFIYGTYFDRAGIFTPEFELAFIRGARDHILFERNSDPLQTHNLFHNPDYRPVVEELGRRILEHNRAIESPECEWLEAVLRSGND